MPYRVREFQEALGVTPSFAVQPGWDRSDQVATLADILRPQLGYRRSWRAAEDLITTFGSLPEVLSAPPGRLMQTPGVGANAALHLNLAMEVSKRISREMIFSQKSVLGSWQQLIEYIRSQMAYETVEQFRILFLNKKNRLIADEVQQVGTVDHTPVYPREVIKRALELSATALILVHNHPSGDPAPSSMDVKMTRDIAALCKGLGIILFDHIIVGTSGHASLRGLKLI